MCYLMLKREGGIHVDGYNYPARFVDYSEFISA